MKKLWDFKKSSVTWRRKDKGVQWSWEWHAYFSLGHFTTKLFTRVYRNMNNTVLYYIEIGNFEKNTKIHKSLKLHKCVFKGLDSKLEKKKKSSLDWSAHLNMIWSWTKHEKSLEIAHLICRAVGNGGSPGTPQNFSDLPTALLCYDMLYTISLSLSHIVND